MKAFSVGHVCRHVDKRLRPWRLRANSKRQVLAAKTLSKSTKRSAVTP